MPSAWTPRQKGLVLLLAAINTLSFIDRQLPYILVDELKSAFKLTNFEFGLLTGPAFAAVYALASLPLARLADGRHARSVLIASLLLWTAMTGAGAFAFLFGHLLISRFGVALGEAGGTPAAHKLIAQEIPGNRLGTAIAIFSLGAPIGIMAGLMLGGWLGATFGWRGAFLVMVPPGIFLAALAAWKLPAGQNAPLAAPARNRRFYSLLAYPPFAWLCAAVACFGVAGYAIVSFTPLLMIKAFGWPTMDAGLWLGLANGVAGALGVLLGGHLVDRLGARDARWRTRVPLLGMLASVPVACFSFFATTAEQAILGIGLLAATTLIYQAPSFALGLSMVRPDQRATASALLLIMSSMVGGTVGPLAVGALTDALAPHWGDDSLRIALLVVPLAMFCAAFAFWRCGQRQVLFSERQDLHEGL